MAASSSELACAYAALILHDDGVDISSEKIATLLKAANVEFDAFWPGLFAKSISSGNIGTLVSNIGAGGSGAPAGAAAATAPVAGGAAKAPVAAKAPEPEPEEEAAMDFDLFG